MKRPSHPLSRTAAFSLPEVTIAMGIVAVLMLPALAMLAGGGSMEILSRDRETSSRIARAIVAGARGHEGGGQYRIDFSGGGSIEVPVASDGVEETAYLLFGEGGLFLAEIGEGDYEQGLDPAGGGRYFVKLRLAGSDPDPGLQSLDLSVEQPSAAARGVRETEIFQTRLAIP